VQSIWQTKYFSPQRNVSHFQMGSHTLISTTLKIFMKSKYLDAHVVFKVSELACLFWAENAEDCGMTSSYCIWHILYYYWQANYLVNLLQHIKSKLKNNAHKKTTIILHWHDQCISKTMMLCNSWCHRHELVKACRVDWWHGKNKLPSALASRRESRAVASWSSAPCVDRLRQIKYWITAWSPNPSKNAVIFRCFWS